MDLLDIKFVVIKTYKEVYIKYFLNTIVFCEIRFKLEL